MFSFEFIKQMQDYIKTFLTFSIPVMICDLNFQLYWSNSAAKNAFPELSDHFLQRILAHDRTVILDLLQQDGHYESGDLMLAPSINVRMTGLYKEERMVGIGIFFPPTALNDFCTKTANSLSDNIRLALHDVFSTTDALGMKSELLHTPWVKSYLNSINMASYQILRVSNNLSAFTKLQSPQVDLNVGAFMIDEWLESVTGVLDALAADIGVKVSVQVKDATLTAAVDPELFQLAFFNVLHNSLYYTTPNNTIKIVVKKENDQVVIQVKDSGLGISEKILPRICEPYFSYAIGGQLPGVGLGLAIVERIIAVHGGTLKIRSREKIGTTVTMTLPLTTPMHTYRLAQNTLREDLQDRFSSLYIGITSALLTPYAQLK